MTSPVEIKIENHGRFAQLKTLTKTSLADWLKKEYEYWNEIYQAIIQTGNDSVYQNRIGHYAAKVNDIIRSINAIHPNAVHDHFNDFFQLAKYQLPFHENDDENILLHLVRTNSLAPALFGFSSTLKDNDRTFNSGYNDELFGIQENISTNIKNQIDHFEKELKSKLGEAKVSFDIAANEINTNVLTATKSIALAEPVTYWQESQDTYNSRAKKYGRYAVLSSISFLILIIGLIIFEYSGGINTTIGSLKITIPSNSFGIALLLILTTASVWIVRVLVKLMMTNISLGIEALERATMIKTFLALENSKTQLNNEIQTLFFTTLFRPTSNTLSDDSTSPEYIRLIEAIMPKKT